MKGAVRLYIIAHKKEFKTDQAKGTFWKVICKQHEEGCSWMIRFSLIGSGMWKAGKVIEPHNCDTDDYTEDHFNLNSNMIATSLIPYVMINAQISIKFVQETIKGNHHYAPSYRKAQKGRKKDFEMVYGDFEGSFRALPRYMAALEHFNPGTIVEWTHESTTMQGEHIFKYLFWAFKPSMDEFKSCRPVISIDGTHVYVARESYASWTWFLSLLWRHVVCNRKGIGLISDRHQGILQCVMTHEWLKPPTTHHRFCVRHIKSNFNKKFLNSDLEKLMWLAATEHQKKKYQMRMQQIKTFSPAAHMWLSELPKEKWTLYKDGGYRWGAMTTNVSESYNGLLNKACGWPVTTMVRLTFKNLVDHFVKRSALAALLMVNKKTWPPGVDKKFHEYWDRATMHTDVMNYNTVTGVFEILTFAHEGKGGNVHKVSDNGKSVHVGSGKTTSSKL
ncbi:uncharacterized protein LOC132060501 [Lycium ferocissimum]|uniref:uncharacterized protein LOC132060501 n=1 Tax=Lycium ferocissimum TaxID=112874 RepID=UPI002814CC69|nr:uncharacterized protein LOC132060501 [Lycium ferocissimum]